MSGSSPPVVLVVDDEAAVADTFAAALQDRFQTRVAYGGEPALEAIDRDVDLVLLDRRMPDLHGDEVLAALRRRGYSCPVVMTTAVDPELNILELDFDDYLTKPVSGDELVETVERQLAASSGRDPRLQEYLSIVSKLSVLEDRHGASELADSEEYQRLQARAEELAGTLREDVADFEEIVDTYRDVDRRI